MIKEGALDRELPKEHFGQPVFEFRKLISNPDLYVFSSLEYI